MYQLIIQSTDMLYKSIHKHTHIRTYHTGCPSTFNSFLTFFILLTLHSSFIIYHSSLSHLLDLFKYALPLTSSLRPSQKDP